MSNSEKIMELSNIIYDIKDKINDGEYKKMMELLDSLNKEESKKDCPCCVFKDCLKVMKLGEETEGEELERFKRDKYEFLKKICMEEKQEILRGVYRDEMDFYDFMDYILSDDTDENGLETDLLDEVYSRYEATVKYIKHLKSNEAPENYISKKFINQLNKGIRSCQDDDCKNHLIKKKEKILKLQKFKSKKTIII